jgi:hypothetical protein
VGRRELAGSLRRPRSLAVEAHVDATGRPDLLVHGRLRLILLSFLMLFVELALIRWAASNVVYLAYFTNFILLASFLGVGVGFLRASRPSDGFRGAPVALGVFVTFVLAFPVMVSRAGGARSLVGWFGLPAIPMWLELPLLFLGAALVMTFIAEGVARSFVTFPPLEAYRLDIVGSILGIAGFSVLSFLGAAPVVWGIAALVLFLLLLPRPIGWVRIVALGGMVAVLLVESLSPLDDWSPYYKVRAQGSGDGTISVKVNGLPHQSIIPLARIAEEQPFYLYPYRHLPSAAGDVLIIGAGTGNDVAVALREGARHVDAVEIDPTLHRIGVDRHPDRPYHDPRVSSYIDDGRAFLERTATSYDMILFALPDSLTGLTGQSSLRLESYLFTVEALTEARAHLKPTGIFSMYNYYRPLVFNRFARTLETVFGESPCVDAGEASGPRQQAVLTVSVTGDEVADCDQTWEPLPQVVAPEPATDDHPFPYLQGRTIPAFYLVTLVLILLASAAIVRLSAGSLSAMRSYLDLFFMGVAFLLLETKNVVQFALLFGTTWFVNALVFAGILLSVLLAIEVARRFRLPHRNILYALLFAAIGVAWVVPTSSLLALPLAPRFLAATALAFAPILLANLVFAERFRDVGSSAVAFGSNLLGAMVGGVLEYSALIVGYRLLLVAVALLYALAYLFARKELQGRLTVPHPRTVGAGAPGP